MKIQGRPWAYFAAQILSAFIAVSASACVLYTAVPTSVVVATVGFCSTTEHFSVAAASLTKKSLDARGGVTSAARTTPQRAYLMFIVISSLWGSRYNAETSALLGLGPLFRLRSS